MIPYISPGNPRRPSARKPHSASLGPLGATGNAPRAVRERGACLCAALRACDRPEQLRMPGAAAPRPARFATSGAARAAGAPRLRAQQKFMHAIDFHVGLLIIAIRSIGCISMHTHAIYGSLLPLFLVPQDRGRRHRGTIFRNRS